MTDFDDYDNEGLILDFVNDAVNTLSNTVTLLCREFLATDGTRIVTQALYALEDTLYISIWNASKILGDRFPETNLKVCHAP